MPRLLLKLRPQSAFRAMSARGATGATGATESLRPLFDSQPVGSALGLGSEPTWFLAELEESGPVAWDSAHSQAARQLGLAESDLAFAEPDLVQPWVTANEVPHGDPGFALGASCKQRSQSAEGGRVPGPGFAWHLDDAFSQLGKARSAVPFTAPRTRIAHLDTGFDAQHLARPYHVLADLQRNFVGADGAPNSAQDPNRRALFDNSGHGTGTIGILAGNTLTKYDADPIGGAPQAEVVPVRIASSVVLLWTSSLAHGLQYAVSIKADVITLSMGGLPSRAWREAVDAAYEAGVVLVAASGDCFQHGLPTHHVVYPARYHRAIAACGVMANGAPYYNLTSGIQGSWGPASAMSAALSTYTPNIPWAKIGCADVVDLDGQGTSAATPQIAAAAALWLERYKALLPRDWRRVEAVRNALFSTAAPPAPGFEKYLGRGILRAQAALGVQPALGLPKSPSDSDSFAFLRVMTGLGLAEESSARESMFELELQQRWLLNPELQEVVPDPDGVMEVPRETLRRFVDAAIGDEGASVALRRHLADRYPLVFGSGGGGGAPRPPVPETVVPKPCPAFEAPTFATDQSGVARLAPPPDPPSRRLRVYAIDPSHSTRLDSASTNEAVLAVRWEPLRPGPKGEYFEVIDEDESGIRYPAVDLEDPRLLAQDGFAPAEGDPRFHQQMVYAVAMTTVEQFERALGRPVLWRPRPNPDDPYDDKSFVPRLVIRPHAFRQANAFYSPRELELRFGHFEAAAAAPGELMPGSAIYTCLSHDIVVHETTHAIVDGLHRRFQEPTNDDVLAFHEAFADVMALMQHFMLPGILEREVRRTRGDLEAESSLGQLAIEFGGALGGHRDALRSAIGRIENGVWRRVEPDPGAYQRRREPHARGALLVAAIFDAFLAIYRTRSADLVRLATGGTGVLGAGAIHPDLVARLAKEARKSAKHVLNLSIRALDYLPPVDLTFGEYLRAIVTADVELVPDDPYGYRVAFVEAFRRRGLYPRGLKTLSVDTLRWRGVELGKPSKVYREIVRDLRKSTSDGLALRDREKLFHYTRNLRAKTHDRLARAFADEPALAAKLGISLDHGFEVHSLRSALRTHDDGRTVPQAIVELTQARRIEVPGAPGPVLFRGGATLVVDLATPAIQYAIVKDVASENREARTREYLAQAFADPVRALTLDPGLVEPFALVHGLGGPNA